MTKGAGVETLQKRQIKQKQAATNRYQETERKDGKIGGYTGGNAETFPRKPLKICKMTPTTGIRQNATKIQILNILQNILNT